MMVSVMLSTIERASQNWYSCFHPTLNRCINLCFEAGKCWKAGLRLRMKYGLAICLGQEISSELLDQFGARILLILIQIYKSGVPNWLPSQNTSHPISHVSRQARVVSMADDTRDDFTKNKHNPRIVLFRDYKNLTLRNPRYTIWFPIHPFIPIQTGMKST